MKYYKIIVLIFIFSSNHFFAQDTTVYNNSVVLGFGSGSLVMRDELMSPLRYSGISFSPQMAFTFFGKKNIHQLELGYTYAKLTSSIYNTLTGNYLINHQGSVSYFYLREIYNNLDKSRVFIGSAFTNTIDIRNHTSLFIFGEHVSSLNLSGMFRQKISMAKRNFLLTYRVTLPVLNFFVNPNYAYSPPDDFFEQNAYYEKEKFKRFIKSGEINTINKFFKFDTRLMIEKPIKECNKIALYYDFYFYAYKFPQPFRKGQSTIGFSLLISV